MNTPDGNGFEGQCLGVEPHREEMLASVEFLLPQAPLLQLGAKSELEFMADSLDSSISLEAVTILRTDDAVRRCYCLLCKVSKRVLLHLMDRRLALRTRLAPSEPVKLSLLDLGDPPPEAALHDISATGISILLEPELEGALFSRTHLRLSVQLPGEALAVEVCAAIRHRRLLGKAALYGLEVEGQVPELLRAQERLLLHVASLRGQGGAESTPDLK